MFKAKKLTSVLLTLVMILGIGVTSFAAVSPDAQDSKYKEAIELLGAMEIMVGDKEVAPFDGDALTVNGYLGTDGIDPALKTGNSIFVLVKTSNKSSGELQDRKLDDGKSVYETMGDMCENWGADTIGEYGYSAVGAVVGATYPEMGKVLRKVMPKAYILVPGYGAQGGKGKDLVHFFNEDGLGAIVNSSRGIIAA